MYKSCIVEKCLVDKMVFYFWNLCLNYQRNFVWYRIKHIYNGFLCDIEKCHSLWPFIPQGSHDISAKCYERKASCTVWKVLVSEITSNFKLSPWYTRLTSWFTCKETMGSTGICTNVISWFVYKEILWWFGVHVDMGEKNWCGIKHDISSVRLRLGTV